MRYTIENYDSSTLVEGNLPEALQEGYRMAEKALADNAKRYHQSQVVKETVDLYFEKLSDYTDKVDAIADQYKVKKPDTQGEAKSDTEADTSSDKYGESTFQVYMDQQDGSHYGWLDEHMAVVAQGAAETFQNLIKATAFAVKYADHYPGTTVQVHNIDTKNVHFEYTSEADSDQMPPSDRETWAKRVSDLVQTWNLSAGFKNVVQHSNTSQVSIHSPRERGFYIELVGRFNDVDIVVKNPLTDQYVLTTKSVRADWKDKETFQSSMQLVKKEVNAMIPLAIEAQKEQIKQSTPSKGAASTVDLWIDDHYYQEHPEHVYDEFFQKTGKFGEVKSVRNQRRPDDR